MKTVMAFASALVLLMMTQGSFAAENELAATDPRVIKICSCIEKGLDANCQPIQSDRGSGDTKSGRH